ncbi:MAG: hypothetical protein LBC13_03300, partial [Clostridiales bacterium]|nr:hypothetical protein [Clostridiales bacterium]
ISFFFQSKVISIHGPSRDPYIWSLNPPHKVFKKDEVIVWECRNCGRRVSSATAPEKCPTCDHPQAYFQVDPKNY